MVLFFEAEWVENDGTGGRFSVSLWSAYRGHRERELA